MDRIPNDIPEVPLPEEGVFGTPLEVFDPENRESDRWLVAEAKNDTDLLLLLRERESLINRIAANESDIDTYALDQGIFRLVVRRIRKVKDEKGVPEP